MRLMIRNEELTLWEFSFTADATLDLIEHVLFGVIRVNSRVLLHIIERHELVESVSDSCLIHDE